MPRAAPRRAVLAGALAVLAAGGRAARAQPARPELAINGQVANPRTWTFQDLQALPQAIVDVAVPGAPATRFTGASLWTLLEEAAPLDATPRTRLRHTLLAQGRDGYGVALAIAELLPDFEAKTVLVAYAQDGKPLPALRLVVPGDRRGGRGVRDLVAIEVR